MVDKIQSSTAQKIRDAYNRNLKRLRSEKVEENIRANKERAEKHLKRFNKMKTDRIEMSKEAGEIIKQRLRERQKSKKK